MIKKIREDLKSKGYSNRKVSVKEYSSGYSSCFGVYIKDFSISKIKIDEIVKKYISIDRCIKTGEVLNGGNTIVLVEYEFNALKEYEKTILEPLAIELINKYEKEKTGFHPDESVKVATYDKISLTVSNEVVLVMEDRETFILNRKTYISKTLLNKKDFIML